MFESKYSKFLTIALILGIIIIISIFGVTGFIIIRNGKSKKEAEEAVHKFQSEVSTNTQVDSNEITDGNNVAPQIGMENITSGGTSSNNDNNTLKMYKGFPMVGTIEIPKTNLSCPILQDATKDAMEVSVGLYDSVNEPGLNDVGNTTIVGHNYRDGRFFADNKQLVEGDKVIITDYKGKKVTYTIYKTYTTSPEDGSHLGRDTKGKSEITLVTCTDDTKSRLIILAEE